MEKTIVQRLSALRDIMERESLDAYYISGTDPHMSEYLSQHWRTRRYISGFSGSWGELLVTREMAGLWTDTRYFIQAEEELKGSGIEMHKLRVPEAIPVVQWMKLNLHEGARIGVDPYSLPLATYRLFLDELKNNHIRIEFHPEILDTIWTSRPPLPENPVFSLSDRITGESRSRKIERIREAVIAQKADSIVISALDDLAWCFNLRGSDTPYNPVFMGYGLITRNGARLFVQEKAFTDEMLAELNAEGIEVCPYASFYGHLEDMKGYQVYIDPATANTAIWKALTNKNRLIEGTSIPAVFKAVKNGTELAGFRQAMLKDGVAMISFLKWLKDNVTNSRLTEYHIGRKAAFFRSLQEGFRGESFCPIVGYGDHGAIVHLSVDENSANTVIPRGILLVDSGGHYETGTTDITRTLAVGNVTPQQKKDFTMVLRGMIKLSMAIFPTGTKGVQLDILARQALWENGLNYGHGTGHGVGHYLNVHEGPAAIRQELNPHEIKPGMVFSNEPGLYRSGEYGIRTENLMVCIEKETTESGRFLAFETLTLCPIDTSLLEVDMLLPAERDWFNAYHARVREMLVPHLPEELRSFLEELTRPV